MKTTCDIMRDTSEPWALVNCDGIDTEKGCNVRDLLEPSCSSSKEEMSVSSRSITDSGDTSTDATSITDLGVDDRNTDNSDNNANKSAVGHMAPMPWPDVLTHRGTPSRYDRELKIDNEEDGEAGGASSDAKAGATNIAVPPHARRKCATQPRASAAVRVGVDGQILRWCKGSELAYLIHEESFPTKDWAMLVKDAMKAAIPMWKGIGPLFREVKRGEPVTFAVIYDNSLGDDVYANSFFPKTTAGKLLVCPLSFSGGNEAYLANVLVHELGHILGLRHEFAPKKEDDPCVLFGSDDPQSVMKYYKDLSKLQVSEKDLEGLKEFYTYDKAVYQGLSVIDISPKPAIFSVAFSERNSACFTRRRH